MGLHRAPTLRVMPFLMLPVVAMLAAADPAPTTTAVVPSLGATATIDLDRCDIPRIEARTIEDAACAQGWIHARERFLQMDIARRQAAGELAALVPQALAMDRDTRPLGLRAAAERAVAELPEVHRVLLERYAAGVNSFLGATTPLEYQLLKQTPAPWTPADSLLVQFGMALFLDGSSRLDAQCATLCATLPPRVADYFMSSRGALDMSIDGSPLPPPPSLPSASELDLRQPRAHANTPAAESAKETVPGSNAFAVAGSRTKDGRAVVGNDMHLMLTAPCIWYRVDLSWPDGRLTGLSLPGVPLIVQGTNGLVAWGFTNLTADLADLVVVEADPADPQRYLVDGGSEPFEVTQATIGAGAAVETLTLRRTRFGPVVRTLSDGRMHALRWTMLEAGAIDTGVFDLCMARTLDEALAAARAWNGPPQNVLVAASDGRIGWTIGGSLPARDARTPAPVSWRAAPAWRGLLTADDKPTIVDPPSGVLTSGNQLPVAPTAALVGVLGGSEAPGDRAYRLRELLSARDGWTEAELHAAQLDVRSPRLLRWRDALLPSASTAPSDALAASAREVLASWNGEVTADAEAPVLLDAMRSSARALYADALAAHAGGGVTGASLLGAIDDESVLRIVETRPNHLLPAAYPSWEAFASDLLARAAVAARAKPAQPTDPDAIAFRARGDDNRAAIRHPAADALGAAARMAEMPRTRLPGHPTCVRVQTPQFGASQRSVVCPSELDDAILVTPCGQAGLPTSPHFRSLHAPWEQGVPFPLLPGASVRRVELRREPPPAPAAPPAQG